MTKEFFGRDLKLSGQKKGIETFSLLKYIFK